VIDWTQWSGEPALVSSIVFLAWAYAILAGPLRGRLAPGEAWPAWPARPAALFYSGLLLYYLAVGSPLSRLGTAYLFSLHVFLQLVILYPAAALIVLGLPAWMTDPILGWAGWRGLWTRMLRPAVTGALFVLLLSFWYVPRVLGWTLAHAAGPAVEGGALLAVAVLFWWPLISASRLFPALGYGARLLYLCCIEVGLAGVFTYVIMAEHPIYPLFEFAPRLIPGLSAENDQVLGGVLLSGLSSLVLVGVLAVNFLRWAATDRPGRPAGLG